MAESATPPKAGRQEAIVSVVVPTLEESARIERCLRDLRAAAGRRPIEIIVADGGSRDGTAEIARTVADRVLVEMGGPAAQLNAGAAAAHAAILL
ncbi:MAG: glycosyltransferase, partial [Planctomycetes bacterium]|nr:glycosyltransferase [Planctomycetota bacterium]